MKPTPQVEAEGLRAYEQVRAFERLRSWRLPVSYLLFSVVPMALGFGYLKVGLAIMGGLHLAAAIFFMAASCFHWHRLLERYAKNLNLLSAQKKEYGDELPWVQVENHFAALDRLKRELDREKIDATTRSAGSGPRDGQNNRPR